MTLTLRYRGETTLPLEVDNLTPSRTRDLSLAEIERLPLLHGNRQVPVAEFFSVAGKPASERIEFAGDLSSVHWIGARMSGGEIRVAGPAGRHLGSEMSCGAIHVEGDASDWTGGEMRGGLIHVRGRAGNLVGAAYRGSRRGMTGGVLLVDGVVGDELGHSQRRGIIAVGGCGDFPAVNMLAGTQLVFGRAGNRPAPGMQRGTLALFGPDPPPLLPSFRAGGVHQLPFLRVLLQHVAGLGFTVPAALLDAPVRLFDGDLLSLGRGEILLPAI